MIPMAKLRECAEWIKANYSEWTIHYNETDGLNARVATGRHNFSVNIDSDGNVSGSGNGFHGIGHASSVGYHMNKILGQAVTNHIAGGPSVRIVEHGEISERLLGIIKVKFTGKHLTQLDRIEQKLDRLLAQ